MSTTTQTPHPQAGKRTGHGLKGKLILSMLLVGVIPLLIGLIMAFLQGTQEIREVSGGSFVGLATETARKLDHVLAEELSKNAKIAQNRLIIAELEKRRDQDVPDPQSSAVLLPENALWEEQDEHLVQAITQGHVANILRHYYIGTTVEQGQPPPVVTRSATRALYITDIHGLLVASLNTHVPYSNSNSAWWQGAYHKGVGKPYIENVLFNERIGAYTFSLSFPIMDSIGYEAIGVLHRVYDAKEFFAPLINPIRFGKTGHVMLIDSQGMVINCPILPTGNQVPDRDVVSMVTLPQPGWVNAPSDGHGGEGTSIIGFASLPGISHITRDSTGRTWHTFVWQSSGELFAPVRHLLTWISVFGLIAVGLLVALGYIAAGRIVTPIRQLQKAAALIGKGEFKEPISIKTGDEIEDLAEEINRMNAQLEVAFAGLSDQVEQKTQEVRSLQQATDQILESVSTPIILVDQEERVQYANRAAKAAFSLEPGPNGQPFHLFDLLPLDPHAQNHLRHELKHLWSTQTVSSTPKEVRDPLDPNRGPAPISERKELHIGPSIYRYECFQIGRPVGDNQRIGLILRDTTEESQRQDKLIQAEKSGSLGVLTAGMGHELNNPLFGILGLAESIQDETDLEKIRTRAGDIVQHGRRMANTIRDFTGAIHRDSKERRVQVHIEDQLSQALQHVLSTHEGTIEVKKEFQTLPPITAIPEELCQAFINILTNAMQAIKGTGTLILSTEIKNDTIVISIQDSGHGIPKHFLTKVFDPFFTTKKQGEGSGLGLTVAKRIINKYNGQVHMESEEGKGATLIITFPIPTSTEPVEAT